MDPLHIRKNKQKVSPLTDPQMEKDYAIRNRRDAI